MKAEDLKAKAQELRDHAATLDEHARTLERAQALRTHAGQMLAEAEALEAPLEATGTKPAEETHDAFSLQQKTLRELGVRGM